jgi:dCTP deaminase
MILTGPEIVKQWEAGRIRISDFDYDAVTTNSYDLRLGRRLLHYTDAVLDPRRPNRYEVLEMGDEGYSMAAGDFKLGETCERIGSDHYVPLIHARSGTARLGLFVHCTADLIDIGSYGKSTLQLFATMPVQLVPGMRIAQVTFWVPTGEIVLYRGKYAGSDGPMPSLAYLDGGDAR